MAPALTPTQETTTGKATCLMTSPPQKLCATSWACPPTRTSRRCAWSTGAFRCKRASASRSRASTPSGCASVPNGLARPSAPTCWFAFRRKRVPRAINLDAVAVDSGDIDVVRVVRQHSASWDDHRARVRALTNTDAQFFWCLLGEVAPKIDDVGWLLPHAIEARRDKVMGRILDDKPATWDAAHALRRAAACGNSSATKALLRAPGVGSLVDALRTACLCDNLVIVQLLIEHDPRLCALVSVCNMRASPDVLGFLLQCGEASDMRYVLDKPGLSVDVARLLHDAYPAHSLQCLLDNAMSVDMARFACDADPHLDLQRGLDTAAQASGIDIVRFVYNGRTTLCIEPGLKHAALRGR
ncbi:hypothetical protein pmac_cds_520 [Pandoravirus macleodensis]|uniref:Ankyrin repeat domain containing protein n=1 Tax=Pandoravirus macleodensis TaxID=2107707 RepID=A0A2U7UFF0_9VIRU|nr:hypothetical protein pmac_cds_520 [Pandoravirus macleodensis]AVK77208.1 hypothetical protein pmac_cds_520 [Pandoravirus macleodensis]